MEDKRETITNKAKLKKNPKKNSHFLSDLLFCWQLPLIFKSCKKEFSEDDLFEALEEYNSKLLGDKLEELWQHEYSFSKSPSLTKALIKFVGFQLCLYGMLSFPFELSSVVLQPLLLKNVINYFTPNQTDITTHEAYFYASMLCVITTLRVVIFNWTSMRLIILAMKIKIACSSLIYRRCLNLKQDALEKVTIGHMVNLLSNDVNKFDQSLVHFNFIWMTPINLVLGLYFLDFTFGHVAVSGALVLIMFLTVQVWAIKKISIGRKRIAEKTDYRTRFMNDIISGIQVIKLYTWEKPYLKLIESARREELQEIFTINQIRSLHSCFGLYVLQLCIFLSVFACTILGTPVSPAFVFALYTTYDNLKGSVISLFPYSIMAFAEARVSIKRIQKFLLHSPQNSTKFRMNPCVLKSQYHINGVQLKNVSVKWNIHLPQFALSDINFKALPKELVGVIGPAGSGKSTLLHVLLREIEEVKGQIECEGTLSYASQEPWIFPNSIKQNILFGQEFDREKYLNVIKVCALQRDLSLFPHGDQTRVGEKGVMLSGGQKSRISLARAVYRNADIYLLDDPLSAVDAKVAQNIFNECICNYLINKCVILVTHQVQFLTNVDRIYLLEAGKITECNVENIRTCAIKDNATETEESMTLKKYDLQSDIKEHSSPELYNKNMYARYIRAANSCPLLWFVFCMIFCCQFINMGIDIFITFWTNSENNFSNILDNFSVNNLLYVYSSLVIILILTTHVGIYFFVVLCKKSSANLHNSMLYKIVNGTLTFFHQHSSGRILNRFTSDTAVIDEMIPSNLVRLINCLRLVGSVVTIIYCNYWLIFLVALLCMATFSLKIFFHSTIRNMKRSEGITRSAVFSHLSTSIQGLKTIRNFRVQEKIIEEFDRHQDLHSTTVYLFKATFSAFGFWLDIICTLFNSVVILSFFIHKIETGFVGLAITQSNCLLALIQHALKALSELEAKMISVGRVVEYAKLEQEPDVNLIKPSDDWPMAGNVSFVSVSLNYNPEREVLKSISFKINSGEKIGIVGRTGAGKTSLISVLFRLFHFDGAVLIDGINTKSISLSSLRSKISIIPQEPVLFLGTLRQNLDPFNNYRDDEIWKCLEEVKLKNLVEKLPLGLASLVSEKGSNFSVGEKQLFCLGRAMLTKNKIVVLDEATANVDVKTDELIQSTLRKKFKNFTVLTIAHRLNTVIDADKILVIDDGHVVEFDHPFRLLQNSEGYFYTYVKSNGCEMMETFFETAKINFQKCC